MNVLERIIAQSALAASNNQEFESVTITPQEYAELVTEMGASRALSNPKPSPPIKASMETWFSSKVEYDHHAPEYLAELAAWKARKARQELGFQTLTINLMTGPCKVVVGYNEV
jgi:hypothetical protein